MLATVAVPAGTTPGSYPLTLTATALGKPLRKGTTALIVARAGRTGAPRILSASLTRARFRVGAAATALLARKRPAPAGTQLNVRLSAAATLAIDVERLRPGHRHGGTCAPKAHRGPRCMLVRSVGKLSRRLPSGASTIAFSGRLGRRALPPGSYRLVLRATNATGARSATRQLPFALVASGHRSSAAASSAR